MNITDALNLLGVEGAGTITAATIKFAYRKASFRFHPDRNTAEAMNYGDAINEALKTVIRLKGLKIELCGSWIWVSGNTYDYRKELKGAGFTWASKKFQWYFRPAGKRGNGRGTWSMDDIRKGHGSVTFATDPDVQLAQAA